MSESPSKSLRQPARGPNLVDERPTPAFEPPAAIDFYSILFRTPADRIGREPRRPPLYVRDLNLDQIVKAITADWQEYDLDWLYYQRLNDLDAITYRQEVMHDLEGRSLMNAVRLFSEQMREMRKNLDRATQERVKFATERLFLNAVHCYCQAVDGLADTLGGLEVSSRGIQTFRHYLSEYAASDSFRALVAEAASLDRDLEQVRYCLLIRNGAVTVRRYDDEPDYSIAVEDTFKRFRHGSANDFGAEAPDRAGSSMNHIQAQVLERVALLFPDIFAALDAFCVKQAAYLEETISRFDREIHFYVAYLAYLEKFRNAGLSFCHPRLSATNKEIRALNVFDLGLARKLIDERAVVVRNDLALSGRERILVISGPNQGGKTTLARTIGQIHHLSNLGCPVPGSEAQLFLFDNIFTHFEKREDITNLRGKLQDDLVRIHELLGSATPNSLVIMNEVFSSTTLKDAIFLSERILATLSELDLIGVWVTFLSELASFNDKTVSVVSAVDPDNPAVRTYKLKRRPADGLAYAVAIAEKYRVTYSWLKARIQS